MARCGDGLVVGPDLVAAADSAAAGATAALDGRTPDLACVFVSGGDPDEAAAALERAAARTGAPATLGSTASGVIGDGRAVEAGSGVSVWAAALPGVRLRAFHLEVLRTPESLAVVGMPPQSDADVAAVLLADPWSFPADGFVAQTNDALPGLPIVGGLAGGPGGSGSTRLLVDGKTVDRGAVGVVLSGQRSVRAVVSQGCRPIGPPMTVTSAEGNVVLALAGVPALDKLREIVTELPPEEQALATQGLQVGVAIDEYAEEHQQGDFLVRGIVGADAESGGIAVGDLVEVGRTVQFQVRDAAAASTDLAATLGGFRRQAGLDPVDGVLLFSCNGRGATLFPAADHDVLAVRRYLSTRGVAGCFAAGEIGPVGGRNHLHGFSASMLVVGSPAPEPA